MKNYRIDWKKLGSEVKKKSLQEKSKGVSYTEMCAKMKINTTSLGRLRNQKMTNSTVETFINICKWLDIHPSDFVLPKQDK